MKIREAVHPARRYAVPAEAPEVTLLIAAYNEQEIVAEKMANCRALEYPAGKLRVTWITDGSTDRTVELLAAYPDATVLHDPRRGGKTAALNRALGIIRTPLVVLHRRQYDAQSRSRDGDRPLFRRPRRSGAWPARSAWPTQADTGAAATEGVYWKYESKLKELDYRLHSAVGAAGELFAVRRELWQTLTEDTLLDDFVCSMLIASQGYKIAYCKGAYALETPSADMGEEGKRKKRIAAGGLQSVWRLRKLLNPFRYGVLWFQYVSHRVLRWTLTPVVLVSTPAAQRRAAVVGPSGALCRDPRSAMRILPGRPRRMGAGARRTPQQTALHPLLLPLHEPQCVPRDVVPGDPPRKGCLGESPQGLTEF